MVIEHMIRYAFNQYSNVLKTYYPGWYGEYTDMPRERNLTFHFANVLTDNGYKVYMEVPYSGRTYDKMDLLAINKRSGTLILLEAKRVFNTDEIDLIADDIERMKGFKIDKRLLVSNILLKKCYAIVLGQAIDHYIIDLWKDDKVLSRSKRWKRLRSLVRDKDKLLFEKPFYRESKPLYELWPMAAILHIPIIRKRSV